MEDSIDIEIEYASWSEIYRAITTIVSSIFERKLSFEIVYAILKGGVIPARIIADALGVEEVGVIGIKFYKKPGETKDKPVIFHPPTINVSNKRVLLVDDIVDTGKTLQLAIEELYRYGASKVTTASLYVKPWATISPDIYYKTTSKWIVFPWEIGESIREGLPIEKLLGILEKDLYYLIRDNIGKK